MTSTTTQQSRGMDLASKSRVGVVAWPGEQVAIMLDGPPASGVSFTCLMRRDEARAFALKITAALAATEDALVQILAAKDDPRGIGDGLGT